MPRIPDINAKVAYLTSRATVSSKDKLNAKRPLYLKDQVIKSRKLDGVSKSCSSEASALFQCLEDNNLLDSNCLKELQALVECDKKVQALKDEQKKNFMEGKTVKGTLHASAVNKLLQKYPNPVNKEALTIQQNLLNTLPNNRVQQFPYKNKWNPKPKYGNGFTVPDE